MGIQPITSNDIEKLGEYKLDGIRQLRKPLLEAFDIYKSNIAYGVEDETLDERAQITNWYKSLLDLDSRALEDIPQKIKRYMK